MDLEMKQQFITLIKSLNDKLEERIGLDKQILDELENAFSMAFDLNFEIIGKKVDIDRIKKQERVKVEKEHAKKEKTIVKKTKVKAQNVKTELVVSDVIPFSESEYETTTDK